MIRLFVFAVILAMLSAVFFIFREKIAELPANFPAIVQEVSKEISAPPPLRAQKETETAFLTRSGIILETNRQRQAEGLAPLSENTQLNSAALSKVQDMFAKKYFAHESPTGQDAADLVEKAGYEFIAVGENLALGNFENDAVLVQAWMDSPGHRANILSKQFQEIGVAVLKGIFEGRPTWLAVQEFGKPLSSCPQPDKTVKFQIENLSLRINDLKQKAEVLRNELENYQSKRGQEYRAKVNQYNALVDEINALIAEYRLLVEQYNQQIKDFNACVAS